MKKAVAVFLLFFIFLVFAEDPLKSIIDKHIIGNTLTFTTHFEEEINDIPGKGLVLAQQNAKDYELNKGNIIVELSLGQNTAVRFLDGQEYQARFSIIISAPESNLILLEITFRNRLPFPDSNYNQSALLLCTTHSEISDNNLIVHEALIFYP